MNDLPFTIAGAAEAALVDAELQSARAPIGAMDTLIAGIVRESGGTLVTIDEHFDRVNDRDVKSYRTGDRLEDPDG